MPIIAISDVIYFLEFRYVDSPSFDPKGPVISNGEGVGLQNSRWRQVRFYLYKGKKRGGGVTMLKGGGGAPNALWCFHTGYVRFSHAEGGAQQFHPLTGRGGGGAMKCFTLS